MRILALALCFCALSIASVSAQPQTFLHSLSGIYNPSLGYFQSEDGPQKLTITSGTSNDKIYYNNWDGVNIGFTSTLVFVNGVERANISHTTDRVGTQFGYSISGSTPQAYGVFTSLGNVYLTINTNPPSVSSFNKEGNKFTLNWNDPSDRAVSIQRSSSLTSTNWETIGYGATGQKSYTDTNAPTQSAFYRLAW